MMLTRISTKNFKCFSSLDLRLAPLTLLTGFNGAGKSSALQPLLLMAQSLRKSGGDETLALNGGFARLGSAGDVINRDGGSSFSFEFVSPTEQASWQFTHQRENHGRTLQVVGGNQNSVSIINSVRRLSFLSALRTGGAETFPFPDDQSVAIGDVGARGEFAPFWYTSQADEKVDVDRRHPRESRLTVRGQIDAWFGELFDGASVNAEAIGDVPAAKLSFRMEGRSGWRRPENVGFGLSYAFPLIVALACLPRGQILIVDSPEAHLHPSAQSKLGQILAHFAASGLQILVESHSDHLLSGIRLALKQGRIATKDTAIHFFGAGEGRASDAAPIEIGVHADGTVVNWPDGFFDQSLKDLVELS